MVCSEYMLMWAPVHSETKIKTKRNQQLKRNEPPPPMRYYVLSVADVIET